MRQSKKQKMLSVLFGLRRMMVAHEVKKGCESITMNEPRSCISEIQYFFLLKTISSPPKPGAP